MSRTSHSRPVIGRLAVMLPAVFGGFYLCQNIVRHGETLASVGLLHALGAHNVISAGSAGILVDPTHHDPFIAVITPSCSSLASVLAITWAMSIPVVSATAGPAIRDSAHAWWVKGRLPRRLRPCFGCTTRGSGSQGIGGSRPMDFAGRVIAQGYLAALE